MCACVRAACVRACVRACDRKRDREKMCVGAHARVCEKKQKRKHSNRHNNTSDERYCAAFKQKGDYLFMSREITRTVNGKPR